MLLDFEVLWKIQTSRTCWSSNVKRTKANLKGSSQEWLMALRSVGMRLWCNPWCCWSSLESSQYTHTHTGTHTHTNTCAHTHTDLWPVNFQVDASHEESYLGIKWRQIGSLTTDFLLRRRYGTNYWVLVRVADPEDILRLFCVMSCLDQIDSLTRQAWRWTNRLHSCSLCVCVL